MALTCQFGWFCFVFSLFAMPSLLIAAPEYQFSFGTVRGVDSRVQATGRLYYTYYGIPFAEPPVGARRFNPPVPFRGSGSNVVITSDDFPASCVQPENFEFGPMSEDCLFLTLYAPASSSSTKKVMVYIPGGGFTAGGHRTHVPGGMVTEQDVIVVVVQYRLGALGWLSSGDDIMPGNLGLRDQLMAVRWVKDNIARFGGDADDITVFGVSAGGVSVALMAMSPLSNGLFQKAVIQSAPLFINIGQDPSSILYRFAEQVGCKAGFYFPGLTRQYHQIILDCLMRKDASELTRQPMSGSGNIFATGLLTGGGLGPVVDGEVVPRKPQSLLVDEDYLRTNGVFDKSYVIGVTNNEGGLLADIITFIPGQRYFLLSQPSNVAKRVEAAAKSQFRGTPSQELLNVVDFVYTYPRGPDGSIPVQNMLDISMDGSFLIPSVKLARALANKTQVYYYLFDHYPQLKDPNSLFSGTNHAMDTLYLFDPTGAPNEFLSFYANVYTPESEDIPAVYWSVLTSFAKSGAPTFPTDPSTSTTTSLARWPRYDLAKQEYLAISTKPEVRRQVYAQRVSLWLDFLPKMAKSGYFSFGSERVAYD